MPLCLNNTRTTQKLLDGGIQALIESSRANLSDSEAQDPGGEDVGDVIETLQNVGCIELCRMLEE